jgi:carbonic anhydrase
VGAALAGGDNGHNLNHLLAHIQPALSKANSSDVNVVVKTNAHLTCDALLERSSIIRGAVESGSVKVVPAFYNLGSGKVDFLD